MIETRKTEIFAKWLDGLNDIRARAWVLAGIERLTADNEACIEEANGDAAFIAKALGDIARAKGMSQLARDAGLSRENLYKALSGERSPGFDTILKVIGALGLGLRAGVVHIKRVLAHYEGQSEDEALEEDEAAWEDSSQTFMEIPNDLIPTVRELIAKRAGKKRARQVRKTPMA
jgi:probable addiction module antidote protein